MPAIPTRRLLVYIATGVVVLVVGTLGLLSMRGGGSVGDDGLVIQTGGPAAAQGGAAQGLTAAVGLRDTPPSPSTTTTQARKIWVQVVGAVRRPGVYQVEADVRVFQAVLEAGGFTEDADQEGVALAAALSDGCRIYVPREGEAPTLGAGTPVQSSAGITEDVSAGASDGGGAAKPVSLNAATVEQLDSLPGIGPSLAQQIITYRDSQGPFTSVDQLTEVPGIGPAKLEQLRPLVAL
jgi:competence protein ComEA